MDSHFVANVICQVIFFFVFVTIFYFTYAKFVENSILTEQINFLIDQTITPELEFICKNNLADCGSLSQALPGYINPDDPSVKRSDALIEKTNNEILSKAIKMVIISFIIAFVVIIALYFVSKNINSGFFKKFNLLTILGESTIIIIFVAITETVFLTYFASRYITVDVNAIKVVLLEKLKDYFSN